jgi:hypothetical protein
LSPLGSDHRLNPLQLQIIPKEIVNIIIYNQNTIIVLDAGESHLDPLVLGHFLTIKQVRQLEMVAIIECQAAMQTGRSGSNRHTTIVCMKKNLGGELFSGMIEI